jgi:glycosyltransferase involved in cell wall biosynthesis
LAIPAHHRVVGTVAVFRRSKRLDDWLEVAAQVLNQRQDVTFLLAGDGPEAPGLRARLEALNLAERVRLPGFRADGRRLMGLMDIYLISSGHEGLPIALLEAMALGLPVVSTAVGGIPEALAHGREGFLAPVGATGELARHTLALLDDPALRGQMGAQARDRIETAFHIRHRVRAMETIYAEILQAKIRDR